MDAAELLHRQALAAANHWRDDDEEPYVVPMEPKVLSGDDELRALQEAHQAIKSQLPYDYLDQFVGLPDWIRVVPTGSTKKGTQPPSTKDPIESGWNHSSGNQYKPLQLLQTNGYVRQNTIGAGVLTGQIGNGLILVDFDEPKDPERAGFSEQTFEGTFEHPSADLPSAPQILSGKPGRYKVLLKVPEDWWSALANWSLSTGRYNDSQDALEVIWENGTGCGRHGTILGDHPEDTESNPLVYRWRDGFSPADVAIPEPPLWFLLKLVQLRAKDLAGYRTVTEFVGGGDEDEPKPFDLLKGEQQFKLISEASAHLPVRATDKPGTYAPLRRAVCGMMDYWGLDAAIQLLSETEWHKKNDYKYHGLGSLEEWLTSLHKNPTSDDKKAHIGSFFGVAEDGGWEFPDWAKPPREPSPEFMSSALKSAKYFRESWEHIKLLDVAVERRLALKNLQKELGLTPSEFNGLVRDRLTEQSEENEDLSTVSAVMAKDFGDEQIIKGFIPGGSVMMIAASGGCGKSAWSYACAEAVSKGEKFLGVFDTVKAQVLFIQGDESPKNAKVKWKRMDYRADDSMVEMVWSWTPSQLPELEEKIRAKGVKLVFMDSFGTLFGGGETSMNDAEVGLYMYELNRIAARTGAAIVVTHHLKKDRPKHKDGRPKPVTLSEFFGSSYIINGVSDAWGMWRTSHDTEAPRFSLRYLKDRSMLAERGYTLQLEGSEESLRFFLSEHGDGGVRAIEGRQNLHNQLLAALKAEAGEWMILDELKNKVGATNDKRSISRELSELVSNSATTGVARKAIKTGGKGRPSYEYSYLR